MAPKKKQEKMALGDFLANQSLGSWADEMDSQPLPAVPSAYGNRDRDQGGERRSFTQPAWGEARGAGGMNDRGASYDRPRFSEREQLPLPSKPPYTAHLGNLAYDVTQTDIEGFMGDCEVTNVRIVEDKLDHKPKGFGYVEFATLDGLKKALTLTESNFMGRNIKISIAEPPKERAESTRDMSDWSRKGPLPSLPQDTRQGSRGFSRNFDNASEAGDGDRRRPGFFEGDGKVRDFGNWERKGPLSPVAGAAATLPLRDGGRLREGAQGGPQERRQSPAWGEGRSDAGSRPPRKEFEPRPQAERVPTAAEMDNQWRSKMRADPSPVPTPEASTPASPAAQTPKERPRLNLAKRTVSSADPDAAAAGDSKASPFGAARPIDTAQREREIEEKRQIALKQKKEADDKAKEEKAARDAAAKAERGQANEEDKANAAPSGAPRGPRRTSRQQNGAKPQSKENGEQQRASFHILAREGEDATDDAVDAPANGNIVGDKETKPQEVTVTKDVAEGAAQTTADALEDDGWSTVAAKPKNNRRGGGRALAS